MEKSFKSSSRLFTIETLGHYDYIVQIMKIIAPWTGNVNWTYTRRSEAYLSSSERLITLNLRSVPSVEGNTGM